MIGIYAIENIKTNKLYIGKSIKIENRFKKHVYNLRRNQHHSASLQNSFNKHGEEVFIFGIIEECSKEELDKKERYWVKYYNTYSNGYNCAIPNGINQGKEMTADEKAKTSESMKKYHSKRTKKSKMEWSKNIHKHPRGTNKNYSTVTLYTTDLKLLKVLPRNECADFLNITVRRLSKTLHKIRNERGFLYKNYIILKENETLEEFLQLKNSSIRESQI